MRVNSVRQQIAVNLLVMTLVLMTAAPLALATVIVAEATSKRVVLGADSKWLGADPEGHTISTSECKIFKVGPIALAYSSIVGFNGSTNFDEETMIQDAIRGSSTVAEAVAHFQTIDFTPFRKALIDSRYRYPQIYKLIPQRNDVSGVVFAGFEKSMPVLCGVKIALVNKQPGVAEVRTTVVGNCEPNQKGRLMFLGITEGPEQFFETHPHFMRDIGPVDAVRQLVSAGITAAPQFAGPPIVIAEIDASGFHYVTSGDQAGPCQ